MTTVTVAAGKTLTVSYHGFEYIYTAGQTVSVPTHVVAQLQAQGIVT